MRAFESKMITIIMIVKKASKIRWKPNCPHRQQWQRRKPKTRKSRVWKHYDEDKLQTHQIWNLSASTTFFRFTNIFLFFVSKILCFHDYIWNCFKMFSISPLAMEVCFFFPQFLLALLIFYDSHCEQCETQCFPV